MKLTRELLVDAAWEAIDDRNDIDVGLHDFAKAAIEGIAPLLLDEIAALDYIDQGTYDEWTGSLRLSEDQWGAIRDTRDTLNELFKEGKDK